MPNDECRMLDRGRCGVTTRAKAVVRGLRPSRSGSALVLVLWIIALMSTLIAAFAFAMLAPEVCSAAGGPRAVGQAAAEGAGLGLCRFLQHKTKAKAPKTKSAILSGDGRDFADGAERGRAIAEANSFTRDLQNQPGNCMRPPLVVIRLSRSMPAAISGLKNIGSKSRLRKIGMSASVVMPLSRTKAKRSAGKWKTAKWSSAPTWIAPKSWFSP